MVTLPDGVTLHNAFPDRRFKPLRLAYDPETDSLYIHLSERASVDSNEIADGVVLDFDTAGVLVGIDLQHASKRADIERLVVSRVPFHEMVAA